ncbi:MAG: TIGR02757 family protein [Myxococcota bacterium]
MTVRGHDLRERLETLIATQDVNTRRASDPVSFVHRYADPDDQEVVGLIASSLAFGNVTAIRRSVERALGSLGRHPARTIRRGPKELNRRLDGFVHRVYRGPHLAAMLHHAARLRRRHGTLGSAFAQSLDTHGDLREALSEFADSLRGSNAPRGLRHLVPNPRAGSACKRLLLYLRWMVRPADGIDLGLWNVSPSVLVIPVDTHIHRISTNLGLTTRKDASWRTAEEITQALRRLDSDDPVRYDFALCHLGVSRECPSRRSSEKCATCVLKSVCLQWRSRIDVSARRR